MEPNDLVLWVESGRALVAGDTLIDRGSGLEFPADWANKGVAPEQILEGLRPLLALPAELVLPMHGAAHRPSCPRARALLTEPGSPIAAASVDPRAVSRSATTG
jgi:glyoxylase-like metal-dependent hydrolase (beta-lactamase superfamily II)